LQLQLQRKAALMKTATFPSLRVAGDLRESAESVLRATAVNVLAWRHQRADD